MLFKGFLCVLLAGLAFAQEYADKDQATREQQLAPNYARQGYQDFYEQARAEPYDFGFQSTDEFGTIMNRQESSDNNGAVRGSYGYTDPNGVFRHVDYVADENGFRAEVKSNEPGMGTQSPANVQIYAEPPPAGVIVERPYHPYYPAHHQGQQGGQSGQRNPASTSNAGANAQGRPVRSGSGGRAQAGSNNRRVVRPAPYPYAPSSQQGSAHQQGAYQQGAYQQGAYQQGAHQQGSYQQSSSQYPSTVSNQYAANAQYSQESANAYPARNQYGQESANAYPSRSQYPSYGSQSVGQQQANTGSSSASSGQAPIVAKPYDGPRYRIGNPHVTDLKRSADKDESGTILLPTLVATGNGPTTLVKHIYTNQPAPTA